MQKYIFHILPSLYFQRKHQKVLTDQLVQTTAVIQEVISNYEATRNGYTMDLFNTEEMCCIIVNCFMSSLIRQYANENI